MRNKDAKQNLFWIYQNHDDEDIEALMENAIQFCKSVLLMCDGDFDLDMHLYQGKNDLSCNFQLTLGSLHRPSRSWEVTITDKWLGDTDKEWNSEVLLTMNDYMKFTKEYLARDSS